MADADERWSALLESVWVPALASSNLASSAVLACGNAGRSGRRAGAVEWRLSHFLAQFWFNFRASASGVPGAAVAVVPGHRSSESVREKFE